MHWDSFVFSFIVNPNLQVPKKCYDYEKLLEICQETFPKERRKGRKLLLLAYGYENVFVIFLTVMVLHYEMLKGKRNGDER